MLVNWTESVALLLTIWKTSWKLLEKYFEAITSSACCSFVHNECLYVCDGCLFLAHTIRKTKSKRKKKKLTSNDEIIWNRLRLRLRLRRYKYTIEYFEQSKNSTSPNHIVYVFLSSVFRSLCVVCVCIYFMPTTFHL